MLGNGIEGKSLCCSFGGQPFPIYTNIRSIGYSQEKQDFCWGIRNTWQACTMLDNAVALASIEITLTLTK